MTLYTVVLRNSLFEFSWATVICNQYLFLSGTPLRAHKLPSLQNRGIVYSEVLSIETLQSESSIPKIVDFESVH